MDDLILRLLWPTPTASRPPPRPLGASWTQDPTPDLDASPVSSLGDLAALMILQVNSAPDLAARPLS